MYSQIIDDVFFHIIDEIYRYRYIGIGRFLNNMIEAVHRGCTFCSQQQSKSAMLLQKDFSTRPLDVSIKTTLRVIYLLITSAVLGRTSSTDWATAAVFSA